MRPVRNFKVLDCRREAGKPVGMVYSATQSRAFYSDFELLRQTRRSALSIALNLAEGYARRGNKEFVQFVSIAKGSCAELEAGLLTAHDLNYLSNQQLSPVLAQVERVTRLVGGLLRHLGKVPIGGRDLAPQTAIGSTAGNALCRFSPWAGPSNPPATPYVRLPAWGPALPAPYPVRSTQYAPTGHDARATAARGTLNTSWSRPIARADLVLLDFVEQRLVADA